MDEEEREKPDSESNEPSKERLKELQGPIEQTLFDIRKVLSELENPFNYLGRFLPGLEDGRPIQGKGEEPEPVKAKQETASIGQAHEPLKARAEEEFEAKAEAIDREELCYINALAAAGFLVSLFGRDMLHRVIWSCARTGCVSDKVVKAIEDALENLPEPEAMALFFPPQPTAEDHIIAAYLLSKLSKEPFDPLFQILVKLLSKAREASKQELRFPSPLEGGST